MKATVKIFFIKNATKVVKINNPQSKSKSRIRMRILTGSKNVVDFGFGLGLPSLIFIIKLQFKLKNSV